MALVAVLLGGKSAEREVSLKTGTAVANALRELGHEVAEVDGACDMAAELTALDPDKVFIALHGRWGEDGTVQGMLEILELPYTGSGVLASALAMDKTLSKILMREKNIPTPDYQLLEPGQNVADVTLAPPLVAKPPCEGSTIGVGIARTEAEIGEAIAAARECQPAVLLERFIEGRELTLSVINGEPTPLIEIIPKSGFYDYKSKYTSGMTKYICPAVLDPVLSEGISRIGVATYKAVGCSGAARVDFILDGNSKPWVLEVNTIPGMTPTSLLPKAASAMGMDFNTLVERILSTARLHV